MIASTNSALTATVPERRLRAVPAIILIVSLGLILTDNLVNIGRVVDELTKFYLIWRLTPLDFGICLLFAWGAVEWRSVRRYINKLPVLVALAATVMATIVGILNQPRTGVSWLLYDVRIMACLFAGIVLGVVMVRTGQFLRLVAIFAFIASALLVYSGTTSEAFRNAVTEGVGRTRVADPNIFYYWEFLLIPCGILGVRRSATTKAERVAFWFTLVSLVLLGVVVAATRSCLMVLTLLCCLLVLVWMKRARVKRLKAAAIGFCLLVFVGAGAFAGWTMFRPTELAEMVTDKDDFNSFAVVQRLKSQEHHDADTLNYRGEEVRQMFREMDPRDHIMGKGLGSTVAVSDAAAVLDPSSIERVPGLHISIFNIWLKFGALSFFLVVAFVLVVWPHSFLRALLKREMDTKLKAALTCYPAAGGATSLMFMSGGFTPQMFLWLGILYAYFVDTKKDRSGTAATTEEREVRTTRDVERERSRGTDRVRRHRGRPARDERA